MEPVLIAGGGIAGLTVALALAKTGRASIVLERAAEFSEVGAGLQISPNAASVLSNLGLGNALDAVAGAPEAIIMRSGKTGRAINQLAIGSYCRSHYGHPYRVAHRADLLKILAAAAANYPLISLQMQADIGDVTKTPAGVGVIAMDGRSFSGPALIAANGVWSTMRTKTIGLHPAAHSGRSAWRATVPASALADSRTHSGSVGLWMGPGAHLVHYPLRDGKMINLVAVVQDRFKDRTWEGEGDVNDLQRHYRTWCRMAQSLIAAPTETGQGWRRWPLYEARPEAYKSRDPVVLIGDAWHATLPFMAQGAAMAIEDAAVLAHCMDETKDILQAFERFQDQRLARTSRLVGLAHRNGRIYHLSGAMAFARDAALSALSSDRLLDQLDWIYGWKPPGPN